MSGLRKNRIATLALVASISSSLGARDSGESYPEPPLEMLRALVEGHARAIETNSRERALWYVHPQSPQRPEIDAGLRDQLASYLEHARTSGLERSRLPDGTVAATVEQDVLRIFGLKITRETRRSIYRFRELGGSWRIWRIDEVAAR